MVLTANPHANMRSGATHCLGLARLGLALIQLPDRPPQPAAAVRRVARVPAPVGLRPAPGPPGPPGQVDHLHSGRNQRVPRRTVQPEQVHHTVKTRADGKYARQEAIHTAVREFGPIGLCGSHTPPDRTALPDRLGCQQAPHRGIGSGRRRRRRPASQQFEDGSRWATDWPVELVPVVFADLGQSVGEVIVRPVWLTLLRPAHP